MGGGGRLEAGASDRFSCAVLDMLSFRSGLRRLTLDPPYPRCKLISSTNPTLVFLCGGASMLWPVSARIVGTASTGAARSIRKSIALGSSLRTFVAVAAMRFILVVFPIFSVVAFNLVVSALALVHEAENAAAGRSHGRAE